MGYGKQIPMTGQVNVLQHDRDRAFGFVSWMSANSVHYFSVNDISF